MWLVVVLSVVADLVSKKREAHPYMQALRWRTQLAADSNAAEHPLQRDTHSAAVAAWRELLVKDLALAAGDDAEVAELTGKKRTNAAAVWARLDSARRLFQRCFTLTTAEWEAWMDDEDRAGRAGIAATDGRTSAKSLFAADHPTEAVGLAVAGIHAQAAAAVSTTPPTLPSPSEGADMLSGVGDPTVAAVYATCVERTRANIALFGEAARMQRAYYTAVTDAAVVAADDTGDTAAADAASKAADKLMRHLFRDALGTPHVGVRATAAEYAAWEPDEVPRFDKVVDATAEVALAVERLEHERGVASLEVAVANDEPLTDDSATTAGRVWQQYVTFELASGAGARALTVASRGVAWYQSAVAAASPDVRSAMVGAAAALAARLATLASDLALPHKLGRDATAHAAGVHGSLVAAVAYAVRATATLDAAAGAALWTVCGAAASSLGVMTTAPTLKTADAARAALDQLVSDLVRTGRLADVLSLQRDDADAAAVRAAAACLCDLCTACSLSSTDGKPATALTPLLEQLLDTREPSADSAAQLSRVVLAACAADSVHLDAACTWWSKAIKALAAGRAHGAVDTLVRDWGIAVSAAASVQAPSPHRSREAVALHVRDARHAALKASLHRDRGEGPAATAAAQTPASAVVGDKRQRDSVGDEPTWLAAKPVRRLEYRADTTVCVRNTRPGFDDAAVLELVRAAGCSVQPVDVQFVAPKASPAASSRGSTAFVVFAPDAAADVDRLVGMSADAVRAACGPRADLKRYAPRAGASAAAGAAARADETADDFVAAALRK